MEKPLENKHRIQFGKFPFLAQEGNQMAWAMQARCGF